MFPDFLCIGAQKAGTSWLYWNMRLHPQIWLPPIKELHYFDHPTSSVLGVILGRQVHQRIARNYFIRQLLRMSTLRGSIEDLRWASHYCMVRRGDEWYRSLFAKRAGQISGEVTPAYAWLAESQVARIRDLMPSAKLIYTLRNPVERSWSQASMYFRKRGSLASMESSNRDIRHFFERKDVIANSDYMNNLAKWEKYYHQEQIFVGFFDDLERNPRCFFRAILGFLRVDASDKHISSSIEQKRHVGRAGSVPDWALRTLARIHYEQLKALHRRFANDSTASWLHQIELYLE